MKNPKTKTGSDSEILDQEKRVTVVKTELENGK